MWNSLGVFGTRWLWKLSVKILTTAASSRWGFIRHCGLFLILEKIKVAFAHSTTCKVTYSCASLVPRLSPRTTTMNSSSSSFRGESLGTRLLMCCRSRKTAEASTWQGAMMEPRVPWCFHGSCDGPKGPLMFPWVVWWRPGPNDCSGQLRQVH